MPSRPTTTHPRRARLARLVAGLLLALLALVLPAAPSLAAGTPNVSLAITTPDSVLYGSPAAVSFVTTNPAGSYGNNLSYRAVLPLGVSYVAGSAGAAAGEPTILTGKPAANQTTLLWKTLTDLAPGTTHTLAFKVLPSTSTFGVGGTYSITGGAYVNGNPDITPSFVASGSTAGTAVASSFTGSSEITSNAAANTSTIGAITVTEDSDASAAAGLLRGVHKHQSIYTITIANNSIAQTKTTIVDEYLPPGLEFLGCGGTNADNTTNAPTNLGNKQEYPGSGLITLATVPGCITPTIVDTGTAKPPVGPGPSALYTHIQFAVGDLVPGATKTISYAVGVPLRANTATWSGTTPATNGAQAANLDNNNGPEVVDDTALTNYVVARGFFGGGPLVGASASLTRAAEDLAITKKASASVLAQGQTTSWNLKLTTSEYRDASSVVVTDALPDGLCPLQNAVQLTHGAPSMADSTECLSSSPSPNFPYASADEHADGTWALTWDASTDPALAQLAPNATHTITFPTRTRANYQDAYEDDRPITAGDVVRNDVSVAATARLVCATGAACAPGPAPGNQIGNGLTFATAAADTAFDTLTAGSPSLAQTVASTSDDCSTPPATYVHTPIPSYRPGDRVCWQLRVDYPAGLATQQTTLTDFLPGSLTFDTSFGSGGDQATAADTLGSGVTLDASTATPGPGGALRWALSSGSYVSGAQVFEHRVATTVGLPAGAQAGDVTSSLFKAGNANAAGTSVPSRDSASYRLAMPVMTATKQIVGLNGHAQTGVSTQVVHGGDVVAYDVQLSNASTDTTALGVEAWDRLPAGVACSDVTTIGPSSNPGVCTGGVIQWGTSPAVGPDVAAGDTVDLTYSVRVPTTIQPTQALTGAAGIRQFHTTTNTGGAFFYYPASNIDPSFTATNVPAAGGSATVTGAEPSVTQLRSTSLNESNGAVDYNTDQTATIGEVIHHTVTATLPAGETVRDLTVTNPLDQSSPTRETLVAGSVAQTAGPTGGSVSLTSSSNTVTLSLGGTYTAPTGADTVFTFTFDGVVSDIPSNYRSSAVLSNAATLSYTPPGQTAPAATTAITPPLQTAIVEPLLTVDNQVTPGGAVSPGQTLTYTVLARNGSGAVSPAHDTQLVDTVGAGITPLNELGNAIADGEYTQGGASGGGGRWDATARTITFPPVGTINPGDADVRTFKATVDSPVTGGFGLTNTVVGKTTSLPGTDGGERTAASARNAGYTDSKAITSNAAAATVTQTPALSTLTPGQQQTFTLTVTIPANTKLYDVYVSETLPDSLVFDSHGFDQCTSGCVGTGSTPPFNQYDIVSGSSNTQIVAWDLGDITQTAPAARVISLPFTAHLLATKRGSGSPGTPIVRTNSAAVPAVVSSNRTNKRVFPFSSASPPGISYVFDDASNPSAATVNVVEPVLTVDKTVAIGASTTFVDGPLTVHHGDQLHYKVTIKNSGDAPAYDITIKDTPDTRITNVQMSPGLSTTANTLANGGHPWTGAPNDYIAWSIGSAGLAPGASVSVDYTANLPVITTVHQGALFTNTVALQDAYGLSGATRAAHGGTAFVYRRYNVVNYPALADTATVKYDHPSLSIVKTTFGPGNPKTAPAQIDHLFTWRVVVTNTSATAPATKLTVNDTLPRDWTFEPNSASFSSGSTSQPTITTNASGDQLVWATNNGLAPGASTTLTYQARPNFASIASIGTGPTHPHVNTASASVLDLAGAPADADGPYAPAAPDTANATVDLPSIQVAATPDGGAAKAGTTVPFHVVVSNTGPVEATNVVITDTLPAGTTYAAGTATAAPTAGFSETSANATTAVFRIATLAANSSVDITVPLATDPAAASGTILTNKAAVTSAQTPAVNDNATVTLTSSADLAASKVAKVGGAPVAAATAGSALQYLIGATNNGPSVAQNVVLKDQLPATVTLNTATLPSGCVSAPTTPATTPATVTVTCTFSGATAVGASVSAAIDTTVNAGGGANADNAVKATSSTPDPVATNDTKAITVAIGTLSDLSVVKTIVGSATPHAGNVVNGKTVQFNLALHNAGPSDATGVKVADALPAGLTYVGGSAGCPAAVPAPGSTITCTVGALAAGGDATATITARATAVGPQVNSATISSTATVDPTPANDTDAATVTVDPAAELSLALVAPPTVPADADATYALTVTNNGPDPSTGSTITQTLPAGTTFVSGDPGCSAAGTIVTCTVGPLANHASATVHVVAHVPIPLGATAITTNASVAGNEADPDGSDDVASGSTQVGPVADISLTQTGPDSITAGGTYTFTLSVRNDGPSDAPDVDVTDTLPAGVSAHKLTTGRSNRTSGRAATPSQGSCAESSGTVLCHLGTLPAGASTLITVVVDVPESLGDTTITNVASAKSSIPDPKLSNEAATYSTRVKVKPVPPAPPVVPAPTPAAPVVLPPGSANLSITKSAEGVARAGRELKYQITATNKGPSVAEGVVVDDALLADVQYRAYQSGDGRCSFDKGTLHCKLGTLKVGEVTAIHVTVVPNHTGELVNNATVSADTSDPVTSDNRAVALNTVSPLPPTKLSLVTTTTSKKVRGGARVTYALKVRNMGKAAASNMQVCNRLPAQLAFTSTTGGVLNGSRLCFTQKLLAPGKRAVFKVKVRVAARARKGFITNRAFADAENAATQNASVRSQVITDGKVSSKVVHGFTG